MIFFLLCLIWGLLFFICLSYEAIPGWPTSGYASYFLLYLSPACCPICIIRGFFSVWLAFESSPCGVLCLAQHSGLYHAAGLGWRKGFSICSILLGFFCIHGYILFTYINKLMLVFYSMCCYLQLPVLICYVSGQQNPRYCSHVRRWTTLDLSCILTCSSLYSVGFFY